MFVSLSLIFSIAILSLSTQVSITRSSTTSRSTSSWTITPEVTSGLSWGDQSSLISQPTRNAFRCVIRVVVQAESLLGTRPCLSLTQYLWLSVCLSFLFAICLTLLNSFRARFLACFLLFSCSCAYYHFVEFLVHCAVYWSLACSHATWSYLLLSGFLFVLPACRKVELKAQLMMCSACLSRSKPRGSTWPRLSLPLKLSMPWDLCTATLSQKTSWLAPTDTFAWLTLAPRPRWMRRARCDTGMACETAGNWSWL